MGVPNLKKNYIFLIVFLPSLEPQPECSLTAISLVFCHHNVAINSFVLQLRTGAFTSVGSNSSPQRKTAESQNISIVGLNRSC